MTPVAMDPVLLLLLVGFLYVLVFGALSLMRREGLSARFAIESVIVIGVLVGGSVLAGVALNPLLFLVLLYLITMRSRWTVDLANLLGQRGKYRPALALYRLALAWWPDRASRLLALANRATVELRTGETPAAIATLQECLSSTYRPHMGMRCEATCLYNLAVAY